MPTIDLTDDELAALTASARRNIDADRYPLSPRLGPLRAVLAKLDPALRRNCARHPRRFPRRPRAAAAGVG
jgi:hypothetical protein